MHRPNGTILIAAVTSQAGDPYGYPPPPQGETPPMTAEQLVELLLTPGLVPR